MARCGRAGTPLKDRRRRDTAACLPLLAIALVQGCDTFARVHLESGRPPPEIRIEPGLGWRSLTVYRIELRSSSDRVLWRIDAHPPFESQEALRFVYGTVPAGFRQVIPKAGAPRSLALSPRSVAIACCKGGSTGSCIPLCMESRGATSEPIGSILTWTPGRSILTGGARGKRAADRRASGMQRGRASSARPRRNSLAGAERYARAPAFAPIPAAFRRPSALSVLSHVNPGSSRPKWP